MCKLTWVNEALRAVDIMPNSYSRYFKMILKNHFSSVFQIDEGDVKIVIFSRRKFTNGVKKTQKVNMAGFDIRRLGRVTSDALSVTAPLNTLISSWQENKKILMLQIDNDKG